MALANYTSLADHLLSHSCHISLSKVTHVNDLTLVPYIYYYVLSYHAVYARTQDPKSFLFHPVQERERSRKDPTNPETPRFVYRARIPCIKNKDSIALLPSFTLQSPWLSISASLCMYTHPLLLLPPKLSY